MTCEAANLRIIFCDVYSFLKPLRVSKNFHHFHQLETSTISKGSKCLNTSITFLTLQRYSCQLSHGSPISHPKCRLLVCNVYILFFLHIFNVFFLFFFAFFLSVLFYLIFVAAKNLTDFHLLQNGFNSTMTILSLHSLLLSNGGVLFLLRAVLSNAFFYPFYTLLK